MPQLFLFLRQPDLEFNSHRTVKKQIKYLHTINIMIIIIICETIGFISLCKFVALYLMVTTFIRFPVQSSYQFLSLLLILLKKTYCETYFTKIGH